MARVAGILMPITSLSSPYGIGTIGKEARKFADFLKASGQTIWQILPVGPTSYGDSPYQSFSIYAGNPYMIDLDTLVSQKLLTKAQLKKYDWGSDEGYVDYEKIYNSRFDVLRIAYTNYKEKEDQKAFNSFKRKNASWIKDYALYMAVKKSFDMQAWTQWPDEDIKLRKEAAIKKYERKYKEDIDFFKWVQFEFYTQWEDFRAYVNSLGIKILGDMPIYVAMDSADTWANPDIFWLDENREPVCVAGCPPDYFSETGQLWGNPLYDWEYHKKTGYSWWIKRLESAMKLYDTVRIDHFRGFESYYAIPYGNETAEIGEWRKGPNTDLFEKAEKALGNMSIIAEDLGLITDEVREMLKNCGYPGMKVLQFAFDSGSSCGDLPHNFANSNCIVYTGTHDNMTLTGWTESLGARSMTFAKKYLRVKDRKDIPEAMVRLAWSSTAELAVAQMQDFLGEDPNARMNTPATPSGNWQYRVQRGAFTAKLAKRILALNEIYYR